MKSFREILLFVVLFSFCTLNVGYAQMQGQDQQLNYIYEKPSMSAFSKLYWALSRLDLKDNLYIDNFLLINECDIYKDYHSHEFEWRQVRKSAREYIKASRRTFPLRFEFMQPLRLGDYNINTQKFSVYKPYEIKGTKRFELRAPDSKDIICGEKGEIYGYPRGIVLEFTRPFRLTEFYVPPQKAEEYISIKQEKFQELDARKRENEKNLYLTRDAYLVMKVKIFTSQGNIKGVFAGEYLAHVLAILEGVEIYADPEQKEILFEDTYRRTRSKSKFEVELEEKYKRMKAEKEAAAASTSGDGSEGGTPEDASMKVLMPTQQK